MELPVDAETKERAVDNKLFRWISVANERRELLDLSPGQIEDAVALMRQHLGNEWMHDALVADQSPIIPFDPSDDALRKWLLSANLESHIIQVLELAAYIRLLSNDPVLSIKLDKLKHDRFWSTFLELAMAARFRAISSTTGSAVRLCPDDASAVGDFEVVVGTKHIVFECSRVEPERDSDGLRNSLFTYTKAALERCPTETCLKIFSREPLTGAMYNEIIVMLKRLILELDRAVDAIKSTPSQLVLTPLWNTAYDGLADMYKNAAHLNVSLFPSAVHFYDACGRFEEIRRFYNETLAGIVSTHDGREERIVMLNCLASDMKKAIRDARDTGNELLLGLRSAYGYDASLVDAIGPIRASTRAD